MRRSPKHSLSGMSQETRQCWGQRKRFDRDKVCHSALTSGGCFKTKLSASLPVVLSPTVRNYSTTLTSNALRPNLSSTGKLVPIHVCLVSLRIHRDTTSCCCARVCKSSRASSGARILRRVIRISTGRTSDVDLLRIVWQRPNTRGR